jgi:hypothetical protein
MNIRKLTVSLAILPLIVACSSTAFYPSSQEMNSALATVTGQDGRACVRVNDISGYGAMNDTTVSVSDKFRGHYLMVTTYRCPGIESGMGAAFKGAFTEFCGRRDALFSGGQHCPVQSVFEFENRQAAFDAYDKAEELIKAGRESESRGQVPRT